MINDKENQEELAQAFMQMVIKDQDYEKYLDFVQKNYPTERKFKRKYIQKYIR